jgi:hypothetical protein
MPFQAALPHLVFIDVLGWLGAICVLVPYALVSIGKLAGTSTLFGVLNILGGILLLINTWYHQAYPSAAVNIIWTVIGIYALSRRATRTFT